MRSVVDVFWVSKQLRLTQFQIICVYIYKFKTYLVCLWIKHFQHKYPNIFRFSNIVEHFRMVFPEKKNLVFQHVPTLSNKPRKKQLGFPMACGHHLVTSGSPNPLGRHVVTNDILTAEIALGIPRPPISLPRV